MRNLLTLICCILSLSVFPQKFKKGYVVGAAGDTTRILLKEDIEEALSKGVSAKFLGGNETLYNTSNAQAFGFDGGSTFQRITFRNPLKDSVETTLFAKVIIKGLNSLYAFMQNGSRLFLIRMPDGSVHLLYNKLDPEHRNVVKPEDYQNKLLLIAAGCPRLQKQVERVNYSEQTMMRYIWSINDCIQPGINTQVLYKRPKAVLTPMLYVGGLPLGERYEFTGQLILRFILPSISNSSSINTGVVYYNNRTPESGAPYFADDINITTQIVGVPFTFQQNLTKGIIQPYLYVGAGVSYAIEKGRIVQTQKGLQDDFGIDLIGGAGIEARISPKFLIIADWRYQIIVHYPTIGVAYKFR